MVVSPAPITTQPALGTQPGDDLRAARDFVDQAQSDMAVLLSNSDILHADATQALVRIRDGAAGNHARAIDRAVQAAQHLLGSTMAATRSPAWAGQLFVINKLLTQYASGLAEVEAALIAATSEAVVDAPTPVADAGVLGDAADTRPATDDSDAFAFAAARDTLKPLLKFAETDAQVRALSTLARLDDDVRLVAPRNAHAETVTTAIDAPQKPATVPLETLMQTFTSAALAHARQTDKIISVSYAADDIDIPTSQRAALDRLFADMAERLIDLCVERPEIRQARGESGAGHIALTATVEKSGVTLCFEGPAVTGAPDRFHTLMPQAEIKTTDRHIIVRQALSALQTNASDTAPPRQDALTPTDVPPMSLGDVLSEALA